MNWTIIRPQITKAFAFNGHRVTVKVESGHGADEPDPMSLDCPECGLPFVVAQCVLLMATHNIRKMVVDGAELVRIS